MKRINKVYFAARYSRREELCWYREQLFGVGISVTSRWIDGGHKIIDGESKERKNIQFAEDDIADLRDADTVVLFTEMAKEYGRGGRHVEYGMALALDKQLIIVGPLENVFHYLPKVAWFLSFEFFMYILTSPASDSMHE